MNQGLSPLKKNHILYSSWILEQIYTWCMQMEFKLVLGGVFWVSTLKKIEGFVGSSLMAQGHELFTF
jgi:hypothetical protein